MKKFLRILGKLILYTLGVIVLLILVAFASVYIFFPRSEPAADITIEPTAERLERGRYLFENVAACNNCHSERDWRYYSAPVIEAEKGAGKYVDTFGQPYAHSANITPAGMGEYSDGELVRAMTAGIKQDGSPVHPLMSYDTYAQMPEEDVHAVVAYLRTLAPVEKEQPENELAFPFTIISRILPSPWEPPPPIDRSDTVAYGKYLASLGDCGICHGFSYGGGRRFDVPSGGVVRASNISPDPETGIGAWSKENFIGVFKAFSSPESQAIPVPDDQIGTVMPWTQYAGMTDEDLGAIYDYLRTVPPVVRQIDNRPDPLAPRPALPGEEARPAGGGEPSADEPSADEPSADEPSEAAASEEANGR